MAYTLVIFVLTIEHYFLIKAFWDKTGATQPESEGSWQVNEGNVHKISLVNVGQDRF